MEKCEAVELVELGDMLIDELGLHKIDALGLTDREWQFACVCKIADTGSFSTLPEMDRDIGRFFSLIMDLSI